MRTIEGASEQKLAFFFLKKMQRMNQQDMNYSRRAEPLKNRYKPR
jgi:hypothetical protein